MVRVVLYQPEIPPNTGNIGRLCVAAGCELHLIKPLGFSLDEKARRRAGLDYWEELDLKVWESFADFERETAGSRKYYFTTKGARAHWDLSFQTGDYLVFGPETRGLPELILSQNREFLATIPMSGGRSLNLSNAVSIGVYEALRQLSGKIRA